jgi:thiamine-phosphate pyrophosphorylase
LFLYYITDRRQLSPDPVERMRLLLERIRMAAAAGVDAIQLREKDLNARELTNLGLRAAETVRQANAAEGSRRRTRLLINSRVDVAIASGADGVHLRSDDISAADARAIFSRAGATQPFIGVSCHTAREVGLAAGHGADFAVFGPVFGKAGSENPAGIEGLVLASRAGMPSFPVLALGGVTAENAASCIYAGVAGIAGIRIFQNGNIMELVSRLRDLEIPSKDSG